MEKLFFVLSGFISGIFGGMGMGGGTVLIPILTMFFFVEQKTAQGVNLAVFIPTALISTLIYLKGKFIDKNVIFSVGIPAIISASVCSYLLNFIPQNQIRVGFGWFLCTFGTIFLLFSLKKQKNT